MSADRVSVHESNAIVASFLANISRHYHLHDLPVPPTLSARRSSVSPCPRRPHTDGRRREASPLSLLVKELSKSNGSDRVFCYCLSPLRERCSQRSCSQIVAGISGYAP